MFKKRGGIHPLSRKQEEAVIWADKPIQIMPAPERVYIPLVQHLGSPAEPLVAKGQYVRLGELIAARHGQISANIHSSVSGKVVEIANYNNAAGKPVPTIVIDNDNVYERAEFSQNPSPSREEIIAAAEQMGLAGMGGAAFPTHVKLATQDKIDFLIINGAECEPYLTADNRLMIEHSLDILLGARLSAMAVGAPRILIGIEANKPEAIKIMKEQAERFDEITVHVLPKRYPMGAEKQLIYQLTRRQVPSGALPSKIGCVVQNVATAAALYAAAVKGEPVTGRITTVAGSAIGDGYNLYIPLGTRICDVLNFLDIDSYKVAKIISGGPMMGTAAADINSPVIKGTSGLLLLNKKDAELPEESACIRCGKCVQACPVGLVPAALDAFQRAGKLEECAAWHIKDCIECGSCTFVCPAKRYLMQSLRLGKAAVIRKEREAK
ncbi:MAG: electron transport complex subunit RsxC [Christensenellaceae bacterium]|nr:electron transport complex subunit RsxC [Christensenellaceae bacterium]